MKLQSLNCPNCGSPLKTQGNMQICESCGSSFKIDYDDSDVAYERLSKEDELAKQRFEHEKEMLETEYRLKEEARIKQAKYEKSEQRKKKAARSIKALIVYIIFFGFWFGIGFVVYRVVKGESAFNLDKLQEMVESTTETTVSPYLLVTPADIEADSEFMDNAIASVYSSVHSSRDGKTVTSWENDLEYFTMVGEPEIYDCYLLTSEDENRLVFLVAITYLNDNDEDDYRVVYDALYLRNITFGNTLATKDKLVCDYSVRDERGEGATDWAWVAATDSDQLYRSAILGMSDFENAIVNLPEIKEVPVETTVEETEAEDDYEED